MACRPPAATVTVIGRNSEDRPPRPGAPQSTPRPGAGGPYGRGAAGLGHELRPTWIHGVKLALGPEAGKKTTTEG